MNMKKIIHCSFNFSSLRSKTYLNSLPYLEQSSLNKNTETGVLMLNLGGPNKFEDITPFLTRFFEDTTVIRIPFGLGPYIAKLRGPAKINKQYQAIGGFSPLLQWTLKQGRGIENHINDQSIATIPAFRYGYPLQEDSIEYIFEKSEGKIKNIVLFSQYPQYSCTTGGNAIRNAIQTIQTYKDKYKHEINVSIIDSWHKDKGYINALTNILYEDIINNNLQNQLDNTMILFTAHSLPSDYVWEGDKYPYYIYESCQLVIDQLRDRQIPIQFDLSFQSKVGFQTWLQPATEKSLHQHIIKADKYKNIILSPIGFTSDHLETLYELDQELMGKFKDIINKFNKKILRSRSLNDNILFTQAQANLVLQSIQEQQKGRRKRCHDCKFEECEFVNKHCL